MGSPSNKVAAPTGAIRATIDLPLSKSISNRLLIIAAISGRIQDIGAISTADDSVTLHRLLQEMPTVMDCGMGGTTYRFLLAFCATQHKAFHQIYGDERLLQRPIMPLVEALRPLGACMVWDSGEIDAWQVSGMQLKGGITELNSSASSQFASALMLVGPTMKERLQVELVGEVNSAPYIRMTEQLMRRCGVDVEWRGRTITIAPGKYESLSMQVPPDWSAASFWYQIVALNPGAEVTLLNLRIDGLQGDQAAAELWADLVETNVSENGIILTNKPQTIQATTIDLSDHPDLFIPLAFTHAALQLKTEFTGLATLVSKESDRLSAVAGALRQCGVVIRTTTNSCVLSGAEMKVPSTPFAASNDHRMAMGLAPLCLLGRPIVVQDPDVVAKSYPRFWGHLEQAGFTVEAMA